MPGFFFAKNYKKDGCTEGQRDGGSEVKSTAAG